MPLSRPSTSGISNRSSRDIITPRKQKLEKRLYMYITNTKVEEARKFKRRISELKLILKTPKRVINQSIKRKNEQLKQKDRKIRELKEMLAGHELASNFKTTKEQFHLVKQSNYQLKRYHKKNSSRKLVGNSLRQHRNVTRKLETFRFRLKLREMTRKS